jgi:hypothetical protein
VRRPSTETVLLYLNDNSTPDGRVSLGRAREWRADGLASFFDKGRAVRVHNVKLLLPRAKRVGVCGRCGGGAFQSLCARCRLDDKHLPGRDTLTREDS